MSARSFRASLACASALLLMASSAFAWTPIDNDTPTWPNLPVHYRVSAASIPGNIGAYAAARVESGFTSWSNPACSNFSAVYDGGASCLQDAQAGSGNCIRWLINAWPNQLGDVDSVIGVTLPVWYNNGNLFDADIIFNDVGFCWNDNGVSNGCVDVQSIATHEEGHFLGLGHTNAANATMDAFYSSGTDSRTLEPDDIAGVCALYPSAGQVAAASSTGSGASTCEGCQNDVSLSGGPCAATYNACGASASCLDFNDCLGGCNTQACANQCANQYPSGAQKFYAYVDCICLQCSQECSTECGGSSSSSSSTAAATTAASTTVATTSTSSGPATTTATATGAGGGGGAGGDASVGAGGAPADAATGSGNGTGSGKAKNGSSGGEAESFSACGVGGAPSAFGAIGLFAALVGLSARRRRRA